MGNQSSQSSPHPVTNLYFSCATTVHDKDINSGHNLIKAFNCLDKSREMAIRKSGIPAKCVVFEAVTSEKDRKTSLEACVKRLLIQKLPILKSDNSPEIWKTAKDLVQYGAAVFNSSSGKIHYHNGKEFKLFLDDYVQYRDIDKRDTAGNTLLHRCCENNETKCKLGYKRDIVMYILLKAGANVSIQNDQGRTPLHQCLSNNWAYLSLLLLQHGASMHIPDINGNTGLHILPYLSSHTSSMYDYIKPYVAKCNPNIQNWTGMTPLHIYYMKCGKEHFPTDYCGKGLIYLGANVNIKNHKDEVPIQLLIWQRTPKLYYLEALELNIYAGLDFSNVKNFVFECLDLGKDCYYSNLPSKWLAVYELMLECGAKPGKLYESSDNEVFKQYTAMVAYYASNPLSLMRCSANVIRVSLMPNAIVGIHHLNLPTQLNNYINFSSFQSDFC